MLPSKKKIVSVILTSEGVTEKAEESTPINNFYFTEEDFTKTQTQINDATRHQGNHNEAWTIIKELIGKEAGCINTKHGMCKWTVWEKEEKLYKTKHLEVIGAEKDFDKENFIKLF